MDGNHNLGGNHNPNRFFTITLTTEGTEGGLSMQNIIVKS